MKVGRYIPFAFILLGVVLMLGCEDKPKTENVDSFFDGKEVNTATLSKTSKQLAFGAGNISLTNNLMIASLTLTGAEGTVSWSVAIAANGKIVTGDNDGATYQRLAAGDNVVTAKDGGGRSVSKVINQP